MSTIAKTTETPAKPHLPTPSERPSADVVIYDGHCAMCTKQVHRLTWWDCQGRLAYLSLHDPEVARRYPDLSHDAMMREMYVVDQSGGRHHGAGAIRYLTRRLRRLWWLAPLLHIPFSLPLWQWLYNFVARHRYWFGKIDDCENGSCAVHLKKR